MSVFLNRYESLGVIGRGSMGEVHLCRLLDHPDFQVAVKIVRTDLPDVAKKSAQFEREITSLSQLQSPYITAIFDRGRDPKHGPCLVMEFVSGYSLEQVLKKDHRLHFLRVGRLLACVCHALETAHQAGVVHRDLKPANMMIIGYGTPHEYVKIMDFGLAANHAQPHLAKERLSSSDFVIAQGTPAYLSPEQVRGDDVDGRCDIYALGLILYEMLTGHHPFENYPLEKVIMAHVGENPRKFAEWGIQDVHPEIEKIVFHCLNKYPADRFASASVLATKYSSLVNHDFWNEARPAQSPTVQQPTIATAPVNPGISEDDHTVVHEIHVRMSDRIAAMKIGGFLNDQEAVLIDSQPGRIEAQIAAQKSKSFLGKLFQSKNSGLQLTFLLERPRPTDNQLRIQVAFRSQTPLTPESRFRCERIMDELRKYLMVV